ncbi:MULTISPECIES: hypothetical protein [unclassified Rathayibacter]|uniref:hypothetical protein n=1 Tax=unclassified Rathayibacter TaxID=2609250 RepID=UPI00188D93CF|nr:MULTISPECIES: hypothetical protein [unclassified Rathayibacter]MBF4461483.1 hypothetical protein [Rathayibacter sp. VKM Ac-2879]MBF4502894.1 hypothetical protein [Rathayibacter sp. VKM Ac-2878]
MSAGVAEGTPLAPGRLGEAAPQRELFDYLAALRRWLDRTSRELARLDAAALASPQAESYTSDVVLAQSLRESVTRRLAELEAVWDSGRVDALGRERLSQLIWGRLDASGSGAAVSLVEAVRLCDAVVAQLKSRLELDPSGTDTAGRIVGVRAEIERCRDLARAGAPELERVAVLRSRLDALAERAGRGADIAGPLGQLERDSARLERDLIIAASERRGLERDRRRARELAETAERREAPLRELVARCRREIADPPRLAVPDVSRLGEPPTQREALDAHLERLAAVGRAFDAVEAAYTAPLRERAALGFRLRALQERAVTNGRADTAVGRAAEEEVRAALDAVPCSVPLARHLVEQYDVVTRDLPPRAPQHHRKATP